jgi:hypothetical protein
MHADVDPAMHTYIYTYTCMYACMQTERTFLKTSKHIHISAYMQKHLIYRYAYRNEQIIDA